MNVSQLSWNVLYTMYNFEKKIFSELQKIGIEAYLPMHTKTRKWRNRTITSRSPVFSGYVFLKIPLFARVKVLAIQGVIRILSIDGKPCKITDADLEKIRLLENLDDSFELNRVSYYEKGEAVCIFEGPLSGLKGEVIEARGTKKLLIRIGSIEEAFTVEVSKEILVMAS